MAEETGDSEMTPEERLEWLRERGVQVVTPEERRTTAVADAMRQAGAMEITYICIPADSSRPLEELSFRPCAPGDALLQELQPKFAGGADNVDLSLLQQSATQTLAGSDAPTVSEETLRQVAQQAHVESFTLVHATPSNNMTAVNLYLDEMGMLKRLPLNPRASEYAKRAGFDPPPQFYGDVYMGRMRNQSNLPMTLGADSALDADWLKAAATQNLEYQMEINRITGRSDKQPDVAGTEGKDKIEDGFTWTQTEEELEVHVPVDTSVTSKLIKVSFRSQNLVVKVGSETPVALRLFYGIDVDSGTWTLDGSGDKRRLVISMEKTEAALWPRIRD